MKVGDNVKVRNKPSYGVGKIIRFYANQGTILVDFKKQDGLKYCSYEQVVKESGEDMTSD